MAQAAESGVGRAINEAVSATRSAVATNANLGIVLLIAPLAAAAPRLSGDSINAVLANLDVDDTAGVYAAIRTANPGGLGTADEADVHGPPPPISLTDAMRLAADRDLIARQYANGFQETFAAADRIADGQTRWSLSDAIVRTQLQLLAETPDTLIARKCGEAAAQAVSARAAAALEEGLPGDAPYAAALADLDFFLRGDNHRRNPGASADVIAAALFVLLRQDRMDWPVRFYRGGAGET
ncbi:MAG: triphosphoribosyl-dephospho-CoA synthase, partial [Planctomycetota bacterium]